MSAKNSHIPLTAIILTCNEAVNIEKCLNCLRRVADMVIVDSGSTDNTLDLAKEARPDVRIFEHPFKDFGDQRNWALDKTTPLHSWVLFIDADEYCDPQLLEEINDFLLAPGEFVGGFIAGRNYFLGRWLKHCTMYPSYQLRLLKLGEVRYRKEGHGQREVTDGSLHYFNSGWRHEGFCNGVHHWIDRHNRYSTDEVALIIRNRTKPLRWRELISRDPVQRRRALKQLAAKIGMRPLTRFVYQYFIRKGFLDGRAGFFFCLLRVAHEIHIVTKMEERKRSDETNSSKS